MLPALVLCALLLASCNAVGSNGGEDQAGQNENQSQVSAENETGVLPAEGEGAADSRSTRTDGGPGAVPKRAGGHGEAQPELSPEQVRVAVDLLTEAIIGPDQPVGSAELIARLPPGSAALFKEQVIGSFAAEKAADYHQLAAWLAVEPEAAQKFIAAGLGEGNPQCYMALVHDSAAGRELLGDIELNPDETQQANLCLDLLRTWGGAAPGDEQLLHELGDCEDRTVVYRAAGHLLALGEGGEPEFEMLKAAVRDQLEGWSGAIEGIKISGDPRFADVLVPLASGAEMQAGGTDSADGEDAEFTDTRAVRMAAYALAYLPGEQAALMRGKLHDARSPYVRWQARLGELLHGNPEPWHSAVAREGLADPGLWITIAPPEAVHPELLPLYAAAAYSDDVALRLRAALQLNRYNGIASEDRVARILARLAAGSDAPTGTEDEVTPLVAYQALVSAGDLRLPQLCEQGLEMMNESDDDTKLYRLPAAYYLLSACSVPGGVGPDEKGSDR